jgi:predicted ArsR family transcriptional regulator
MPTNGVHGFYHTSRASFRHLIFRTVLQRDPVSRQQLARLLQIRYVTLQKLLDELLTEKIPQESGNVIVRRGRARIFLKVNP